MKPINPYFWTRLNGELAYRNLEAEESEWNHDIFNSWHLGKIDEAIVIYYEIYDCVNGGYTDDSIYQKDDVIIKPGDRVLDVGANIGIFARFAADKGASKIYSFEPVQENFQLLSLNRPEQCEAHRLAISDTDNQSINIAYTANAPGGSSIFQHDDGVLQNVMSMSLDTLINNGIVEGVDFMKMDIEGAEMYAFDGIRDEHLMAARCLTMEIHVEAIGKAEADKIYNRMHGLGFESWTLFNPDQCNIIWFTKL
mgnify:CR=1 FL=1